MKNMMRRFPSPIDRNGDGTYVYKTSEQYQSAANKYIEESGLSPDEIRGAYLKILDHVGNCA
ncbi:hypothetical protein SAMN02745220_04660 [Desulfopila aestuarii DSM 18488]|uniref:Uncharacterized protein n=1 Tax=Desulfopila aestuarii DSM 18488 TaxID=1121416 RepID=A0A1M7YJ19_9BACT|nr:hypothetical protein SAMN02745220_04660 [Desulfopila aestuarii DSM 18488]